MYRRDLRMVRRHHIKPYCVEVEMRTMLAEEDEEGDISFEWGIITMRHVLFAKGPQEATETIEESMPETEFTVQSVRRLRPSMAHMMSVEDEYDPTWDYEQGVIEEYMESQEEYP